jgi:hypothetical protein
VMTPGLPIIPQKNPRYARRGKAPPHPLRSPETRASKDRAVRDRS